MSVVLGYAHKECEDDGNWFRHPDTNKTWSNYTTCVDFSDFEVKLKHDLSVVLVFVIGKAVLPVAT